MEVELLQEPGQRRREELDRWEKNIQIKEDALGATEKRIDDKIAQIDAMKKGSVANCSAQYNEQEDAKIRSLVKIYENMKPKDAARIFDEIEMPVLLLVLDKMTEKKTAPVLAEMDPKKAKQITVQLAEQRNSTRLNNTAGSAARCLRLSFRRRARIQRRLQPAARLRLRRHRHRQRHRHTGTGTGTGQITGFTGQSLRLVLMPIKIVL